MQTLQGVGWQWRTDGVVVTLQVDGRKLQVLVPLRNVWHEFASQLSAHGVPMAPAIAGPCTVSGLFSSIAHAVSHAASSVAHAATHNAITKAANSVVHTAVNTALHNPLTNLASKAISVVPVLGPLANSVTSLMTAPLAAVDALAQGGRIDKVALNSLKSALKDVKAVAPYAQLVLSAVPGVGTGLSGAIGAGLALASGQNISDALIAGVRGALPGGPLAAAAFDVAHAAMQGKPITQIALNAIPISPAQKSALVQGLALAQGLASGKKVSQVLIDQATSALPPDVLKAIQVGGALAHAKSLQSAVGTLTHAASLSSAVANAIPAANQIKSLVAARAPVPPSLTKLVQQGVAAHQQVQAHAAAAAQGVAPALRIMQALNFHSLAQPAPPKVSGLFSNFQARFHTHGAPRMPHVSGPAGIHSRFAGVGAPAQYSRPAAVGKHAHKPFVARFHTQPHGHGRSHVGAPIPRHLTFHRQFAKLPQNQYPQPQQLHRAWGR